MRARILGTGRRVPEKVLTNHDLERIVDTSDEWIKTRTGIEERRVLAEGEQCSDLVAEAGREAIERAGLTPEQIDVLLVATATPDTVFPATAAWAQPKLGLRNIPVFDLSAACSGWLYGYIVADGLICAGTAKHVLVVGAEALSRSLNWHDRNTCVLFGDGAGATVIGPNGDPRSGLIAHTWGADGRLTELLYQPAGGTRMQASEETVAKSLHAIHMAGNEVYKHAVRAMHTGVESVMKKTGVSVDDITLFIPHQANMRIMTAAAERAGLPLEKLYVTIHKYGNISAASIPISLYDAEEEGRLRKGDLVLTAAFGAGFTWAAALFRW